MARWCQLVLLQSLLTWFQEAFIIEDCHSIHHEQACLNHTVSQSASNLRSSAPAADHKPATASKLSWQFPHVHQNCLLADQTRVWHPLLTTSFDHTSS